MSEEIPQEVIREAALLDKEIKSREENLFNEKSKFANELLNGLGDAIKKEIYEAEHPTKKQLKKINSAKRKQKLKNFVKLLFGNGKQEE